MPVEEPWDDGGLWAAVRPLTGWPQANEDTMAILGQDWTNAGLDGLHLSQPSLAGLDTWSDDAGLDYYAKAGALLSRASEASELMKRLGWLATMYGEDIAYTKTEIAEVINANSGYYFRSTFPLTSWAYEPGTSQRIVTTLASSINAFIDAMADRIAARGATGADLPRPQFVPSELPDQPAVSDAAVPGDPRRAADSTANNPPGVKQGWRGIFDKLPNGKQSHVRTVESEDELRHLFGQMTSGAEQLPPRGPKIPEVYRQADGTVIQWRGASRSGGATIDIFPPSSKGLKVHVEEP